MKTSVMAIFAAIVAGAFLLGPARGASAQTGGGYDLTWNTWDNSGGVTFASGGGYELGVTVGQADAGFTSGGSYTFNGGFWQPVTYLAYVPIVLR